MALVKQDNDGRIVLSGALDIHTVNTIYEKVDLQSSGKKHVRIDLMQVENVDSAGVALSVQLVDDAQNLGINLSFENVPAKMAQLIRVNRVESVITVAQQ